MIFSKAVNEVNLRPYAISFREGLLLVLAKTGREVATMVLGHYPIWPFFSRQMKRKSKL
ncbi:MAG: hypothetical protein ACJAVK_000319 [Akkermansiaceae bacterium]|jgi:hypothetical protein